MSRAQDTATGALGGVVTDATGAAIADARVEVTDAVTGSLQRLATDRLGEFLFSELAPATYRLRIQANGFDELRIARVVVELGRSTRLAPTLHIATQSQTINVDAAPERPAFDTPVNANLSPADLQSLPLDGRRFQSLAPLTPLISAEDATSSDDAEDTNGTSSANGTAADTDNVRLSVRGLDPMHNQYGLDGMSLRRAFDGEPRGGRTLPFTVAQEGVREFQVRAVGAGSATGRDAGGSINTVTRRGETAVHGSAFFLLRNSGVGAANPFAVSTRYNNGSPITTTVKPLDVREQFGGSIGGSLIGKQNAAAALWLCSSRGPAPPLSRSLVSQRSELLQPVRYTGGASSKSRCERQRDGEGAQLS